MYRQRSTVNCTDHAKDFMTRQAKAGKPFLPVSALHSHMPVLPVRSLKARVAMAAGDALMQIDAYTGELLDKVDELGIADNTIFIFTSDNGGEMTAESPGVERPMEWFLFHG